MGFTDICFRTDNQKRLNTMTSHPIPDDLLRQVDDIKYAVMERHEGSQQSLKDLYDLAMIGTLRGHIIGVVDDLIAHEEKDHVHGNPVSLLYANLSITRANIVDTKGLRDEAPKSVSLLQKAWDNGIVDRPTEIIRPALKESIDALMRLTAPPKKTF